MVRNWRHSTKPDDDGQERRRGVLARVTRNRPLNGAGFWEDQLKVQQRKLALSSRFLRTRVRLSWVKLRPTVSAPQPLKPDQPARPTVKLT